MTLMCTLEYHLNRTSLINVEGPPLKKKRKKSEKRKKKKNKNQIAKQINRIMLV